MTDAALGSARLSPDFWRFWSAQALSNLGDGIRLAALPLLTARLTRDPLAISTVTALNLLPWATVGLVGGAIVDRGDRRRIIINGQLARAAAVGVLAVFVAADGVGLWMIYAVALVISVGEVFVDTAAQAAIPMLASNVPIWSVPIRGWWLPRWRPTM